MRSHAIRNDETTLVPFYRDHNFGPSQSDGLVRWCPAYSRADNIYVFSKPGYRESEALYNESATGDKVSVDVVHPIDAFPPGVTHGPNSIWSPRNLIIIPMHLKPASTQPSARDINHNHPAGKWFLIDHETITGAVGGDLIDLLKNERTTWPK